MPGAVFLHFHTKYKQQSFPNEKSPPDLHGQAGDLFAGTL